MAARDGGAVAVDAESRKYSNLDRLLLVAIEILEVLGPEAIAFVSELARHVAAVRNEPRSHQFLVHRFSVAVQRGNAAAVLESIRV